MTAFVFLLALKKRGLLAKFQWQVGKYD